MFWLVNSIPKFEITLTFLRMVKVFANIYWFKQFTSVLCFFLEPKKTSKINELTC